MNEPLVSVVIASYNMEQYLCLAINSILAQTWGNIEVIIIDDGSTDNTSESVQQYSNNKKVRYIKTENQGQPKAKNRGLTEAQGDFIAFCDADDLWQPNKLELQIPVFSQPDIGVVYSEVSYIDEHGRAYDQPAVYQRYSGIVTDQLLMKNFVPFGTAVIRRACIEQNGVFDEEFKMGIDWDLWLRYSLDWKFAYIPDKIYIYREWSGQMSTNYRGRYKYAFDILKKFENAHADQVDKKILNKAWADNYISRGSMYAKKEKAIFSPIKDILKGISLDPFNIKGWRCFIKVLFRIGL